MKFGASSWPFQWDPPYEDCIKRVAGLGFKAIELIGWTEDSLKNYYTPPKIKDLKACLGDEGLVLSQFASIPHELSHGDKARRDAGVELWKRSVNIGAELGARIIHTVAHHPFGMKDTVQIPRITTKPLVQKYATRDVPRGVDWDQNYRDYVDTVRRCATACADAGVMMALEAHPARYVANTEGALRLLEHVNSPALGINFDPSHLFPVGDFPNISIYRLARKIIHIHASDNDGVTNVHWRPGMGKIDWMAMFQALKDVGYDGVVSMELEDVPGVSRGPHHNAPNVTATEEFVAETVAGMNYLRGICKDLGIQVD